MAAAVIRPFNNGQVVRATELYLTTLSTGFALVNGVWCWVEVNSQLVPCFGGREVRIELVSGHEIPAGIPLPLAIECHITSPDMHTTFFTFAAPADAENDSFARCFQVVFDTEASDAYAADIIAG